MNDLETLKEMFERNKISYEFANNWPEKTQIIIEKGYIGFYTVFVFDVEGTLRSVEAYE
tara:strand:+ start:2124 stop:2300 length:177 start_codon:yes stop_codon:yes gene_type:complete